MEFIPTDPYEIIASLTGVISVYFSFKKNILTFPFGIISVLLFVKLCFEAGIYADMGINIFYFLMSVYGWISWGKSKEFIIKKLNNKLNGYLILLTGFLWLVIFFLLENFTDSNVAWIDSLTTALCISGMLLMAWRNIENWIYLLIANIISIPLYIYKELYFSALLFLILTIFAVLGYLNWKKHLTN